MLKTSILGLLAVLAFALTTAAQSVYTPAKGAPERAAILGALRVPVEKELKQKIVFQIDNFKIQGNWAFLNGAPQNANGGKPNYKGTKYQTAIDAGAFDNNFSALLKKTGGKWKVVAHAIGCTDVCYEGWAGEYKAPKAIFQ